MEMDDLDKEHQAEVSRLLAKIERLEKEKLDLARQRDNTKDKLKESYASFPDISVHAFPAHRFLPAAFQ